MAVVVTKDPADISFDGDPMIVELFSHSIDRDQRAEIQIEFSQSLADGDTFDLIWNNYKLSFVARSSAIDDGLDLPLQGALTIEQYRDTIRNAFATNSIFRRFWTARLDGNQIYLTYKTTDELAPLVEGSNPFSIIITDSTGAIEEENLAAHIITTKVNDDFTEEDLLTDEAPFSTDTARTYFDLKGAFNLEPHLPEVTSFTPFGPYPFGEATKAFAKYKFYYAEKFGSPASVQKLIPRFPKMVIHGSLAADTLKQFFSTPATKDLICHDYPTTKIISPDKVEWLYLFTQGNRGEVYPNVVIIYDDGTTEVKQPPLLRRIITLEFNKLYWVASGLRQMGISTNQNKNAIGYTFRISNQALTLHTTSVEYRFDNRCMPHDRLLMVDNGVGGCETVRLVGKQDEGYKATNEKLQIVRGQNWEISQGDIQTYNHRGQRSYTINTGWMDDVAQAEKLRQLLLGDIWWVDEINYRFIRLVVNSSNIRSIKKDDEELFFVSLQVDSSALDQNYSSF